MKEEEIEKIVDYFTEKLYSHQYFIGRKEAKEDLGLKTVQYANVLHVLLSKAMTDLYEEYKKEMALDVVWNPENELGANAVQNRKDYTIACIESSQSSNRFDLSIEYRKQQVTMVQQTPQGTIQIPQDQVGWKVLTQGWK